VLDAIYRFKPQLCYLLLKKHRTRKPCEPLVPRFLRAVYQLRQAGWAQLVQLGRGTSPETTESPKASTTKWSLSIVNFRNSTDSE
jgi:hypothetical protein